jgi:heat shock protein HslJ
LTALNGADLVPGTLITAEFNEEGVVAGSSGCNNYIAGYEVDGDRITFESGSAATTRMMCPEPVMEQESRAHKSLLLVQQTVLLPSTDRAV